MEIFFNNTQCLKEDLSINSDDSNIEITCVFSELPEQIVIDSTASTSLKNEHMLNNKDHLEIKKRYSATIQKPREEILIVCNHPTVEGANDLLRLKRDELRERANSLGIDSDTYNNNINAKIREAIWGHFDDLECQEVPLTVDCEDAKKVYEEIKKYLPLYALFQSDRQSTDDDREITDPMKIAVRQAISELNPQIEQMKTHVKERALDMAERTLEKLNDMFPSIANSLIPDFKAEPKFDSQFKLTFRTDDDIPLNKRGSGVRRLILLNFFRAEAERRKIESTNNSIIYAFEEPENSQHPNHQKILIESFIELSNNPNCQIVITTHVPAFASILPLKSLRFVDMNENGSRTVDYGTEQVYESISNALGILAPSVNRSIKALLLVEGPSDITFVNHTATKLKEGTYISHTLLERGFAIIPTFGCDNLNHWHTRKLADEYNIPWCVLLDSDIHSLDTTQTKNIEKVTSLKKDGIKAYATRKRELENYIHCDCLNLPEEERISYSDTDDAKYIIHRATGISVKKVLETYWINMSTEQIREVEKYEEESITKYEFTEMLSDFLSLV